MCIRSAFCTDIVAAFAAIDREYYGDDFTADANAALLALPSKAIGHPFSVAGALIKAGFFIKDDFGHVVSTVGRACRGYARFLKTQGDLFDGMPAAAVKAVRKPRAKAAVKRSRYRAPRGLCLARKYRKTAEHRRAMLELANKVYDAKIAVRVVKPVTSPPRSLPAGVVDFCAIRAARLQA